MNQFALNNYDKYADNYFGFIETIERGEEYIRIIFDSLPAQYFLKENVGFKNNWENVPIVSIHLLLKEKEIDKVPGLNGRRLSADRWYLLKMSKAGLPTEMYNEMHTKSAEDRFISQILYLRKTEITARQLYQQFSLNEFPDAQEEDLQQITQLKDDSISFIAAYKVGQGNCNALCNSQSEPLLYFDFGCGCYHHSNTYCKKQLYCFDKKPPIILSHWHADHWAAATYSNDAFNVPWIVPRQTIGASAWRHAKRLHFKHNLNIWPKNQNYLNTSKGSIIKCIGRHKNHSGLSLLTEIAGKTKVYYYLLPGDSAFRYIPIGSRKPDGIIAPHHGGYFQYDSIPRQNNGQIIYSYGTPNSFHHPDPRAISRYVSHGWDVRGNTDHGHCAMGWRRNHLSLRLECQGRKCDLWIRQIL